MLAVTGLLRLSGQTRDGAVQTEQGHMTLSASLEALARLNSIMHDDRKLEQAVIKAGTSVTHQLIRDPRAVLTKGQTIIKNSS